MSKINTYLLQEVKLGQRATDVRVVTLEDVRVPDAQRIGKPGEGYAVVLHTFNRTRSVTASFALGVAARALDEATKYSLERKTFGVPISQHQVRVFVEE